MIWTHTCNACNGQIRFVDKKPVNADGSSHWDICKAKQFEVVKKKGRYYKTEDEAGYIYKGELWKTWVRGPELRGSEYREDACSCGLPPWELCKEACQHSITQ